ncbi:MAG: hypothetical protein NTW21_43090 [Verrucomicrobia bacterium]|nr:hypothetical protein [Verrucomicrobiota bacterium]
MNRSGTNLSVFLLSFLEMDPDGFEFLIDSLRHILPYVRDLRAEVVRDMVESRSLLRLTEDFSNRHAHLPGWVLSGSTLRLLAILAALRHPRTQRAHRDEVARRKIRHSARGTALR